MNPESASEETFSADRPIRTRDEDRLARAPFADAVASSIRKWAGKDSLVVGVFGQWGSGKTSLKNLIVENLEKQDDPSKPTIIEFNPWQYSVRESITNTFFKNVAAALGNTDIQRDEERRETLLTYAHAIEAVASVSDLFQPRIFIPFWLFAAFLLGISVTEWPVWGSLAALGLAVLGEWLRGSAAAASAVASFFTRRARIDATTLPHLKRKTAEALATRLAPLLIVMDDLDRLAPDEIQEVFRLVKVHADFPKVVYLLLFQRDVIERALETPASKGKEYMEKIVQIGFDIPAIDKQRLEGILFGELDRILGADSIGRRFNARRWANLYPEGLGPYFTSLRGVYRFLATFKFHVALFAEGTSFGANPVDLIGIEVIRVFEPVCYQAMAQRKASLVGGESPLLEREKMSERAKLAAEEIIMIAQPERREAVGAILKALFPRIPTLGGVVLGSENVDEGQAFRDLRICSRVMFDRYFQLAVAQGDLTQSRIDRLIELSGDRSALVSELRVLAQDHLLTRAIECLSSYKNDLPLYNAESFVAALFDVGEEIPKGDRDIFTPSPMMQAYWLVAGYLRRLGDTRLQGEVLRQAISATEGVVLPTMVVAWEESPAPGRGQLIAKEDVSELQRLCLSKITRLAEEGTLLNVREFQLLIDAWKDWGKPQEVRAFCERVASEGSGALKLVRSFLQAARRTSRDEERIVRFIKLADIEEFVPLERISRTFESLDMRLSKEDREAYDAFQSAIQRRREGKPDFEARSVFFEDPEEASSSS